MVARADPRIATCLILVGAVVLGAWMHEAVEALATRSKLLLARALIWGSLAAACSAWLARRAIVDALSRLAARAEQGRHLSLVRRATGTPLEQLLVGLFLAVCLFLTGAAIAAPDFFVRILSEDGPFETATSFCYAVAALSCAAFALKARGHRELRICLGLLVALFVIVGGEEIAWGQRLLGFGTPESLAAINVQSEFTLHNIYSISIFTYPALATTAFLLFLAPFLQRVSPDVRRIVRGFGLPVAPPVCALLYAVTILAYLLVGLSLGTPTPLPISTSEYAPHYDDEMMEFLIAALFAIFALTNWRWRLPAPPPSGDRRRSSRLSAYRSLREDRRLSPRPAAASRERLTV